MDPPTGQGQQNLAGGGGAAQPELEERPPLNQAEQDLFDENPLNCCTYGDILSSVKDMMYLLLGRSSMAVNPGAR